MIIPHIACFVASRIYTAKNLLHSQLSFACSPVPLPESAPNAGTSHTSPEQSLHPSTFILFILSALPFSFFDFFARLFDFTFVRNTILFSYPYSIFVPPLFLLYFFPNSLFYAIVLFIAFQQIQSAVIGRIMRVSVGLRILIVSIFITSIHTTQSNRRCNTYESFH